ncbi:MAG TPA: META domain-containing protein, partial [Actinomycetales bacterium]
MSARTRRSAMCVLLVATATTGCGPASDDGAPVAVVTARPAAALSQVEWQLHEITSAAGSRDVRDLDSVLRFDGRGGWSAVACNQLDGTAEHGATWVHMSRGLTTDMLCRGARGRLEDEVTAALQGRVAVDLRDDVLRLGPLDGTQLVYRERATIYPDADARTVDAGRRGTAQYRVAVDGQGSALGLLIETRPAAGTAWGTQGFGSPQPEDGPGYWPSGVAEVGGDQLIAGFA